jgi:hypothetical protein
MLVGFLGFHHGYDLLEGNIHEQDMPPSNELKMLGLVEDHPFKCTHLIPHHHGGLVKVTGIS